MRSAVLYETQILGFNGKGDVHDNLHETRYKPASQKCFSVKNWEGSFKRRVGDRVEAWKIV